MSECKLCHIADIGREYEYCHYCAHSELARRQARIDALTGGARELLKALEKRQYLSVPPEAWPDIAPAANRLYSILEAEK